MMIVHSYMFKDIMYGALTGAPGYWFICCLYFAIHFLHYCTSCHTEPSTLQFRMQIEIGKISKDEKLSFEYTSCVYKSRKSWRWLR